jgi:hypothetical protein
MCSEVADAHAVDYFGVTVYSTLELHVGVICACVPALYQLTNYLKQSHWPGVPISGDGSASESPHITIGRLSYRRREWDTGTIPRPSSLWLANGKRPDGYDPQQPSQTFLAVAESSHDRNGGRTNSLHMASF